MPPLSRCCPPYGYHFRLFSSCLFIHIFKDPYKTSYQKSVSLHFQTFSSDLLDSYIVSFLLDLAVLSGRLCKVPQNAKKPTGFYTNRLCNNSPYSVLNLCSKQLPYVICIPLIWKQHRHNPKSIVESCYICVGGIFTIFFVPALQ